MKERKSYPCKDCKERQVGCHSHCERYQSVKREKEEANRNRRRETQIRDAVGELRYSRIKSMKNGHK